MHLRGCSNGCFDGHYKIFHKCGLVPDTGNPTPNKVPSLYRHRSKVNGATRPVGSYTIDIRTKTVGRIFKSTGIFPSNKHAVDLLQEIRFMIKDLDISRDEIRLGRIKHGTVRLLDALVAYKTGCDSAAEAHGHKLLGPTMRTWLSSYSVSQYTIRQYTSYIERFERMGVITPRTVVRDVPEIVRALRKKFNQESKAIYFRSLRTMFISFLKGGLGYDDDSLLLKGVMRVPRVPVRFRREHHPLRTIHDLIALGDRINTNGRWKNRKVDYREWIYFMVFTGLRPTEFERGLWEIDSKTGHLLIRGTKTINARRIIPMIAFLEPRSRRLANLQMRLINLDPPTPVRSRDFRRTAAIWFEEAGIPRSRYSYYLGHGARDVTALYEQRTPSKEELDSDRERFIRFITVAKESHSQAPDNCRVVPIKGFLQMLNEKHPIA